MNLTVGDKYADEDRNRLRRVGRGDEVPAREFKIQRKDKQTLFIESNLTPIKDDSGDINSIQVIWRDVTAHKQHTDAIRQRNRQLNALLDISRNVFRSSERRHLLSEVAKAGMKLLDSDGFYIHLLRDDMESDESHIFSSSELDDKKKKNSLKLEGSTVEEVTLTGKGRISNNILKKRAITSLEEQNNIPDNIMAMPMKSDERVFGVISVARYNKKSENPYDQSDYEYLEIIANVLSLNLEYIRLVDVQHKQRAAEKILEQNELSRWVPGTQTRRIARCKSSCSTGTPSKN